MAAGCVENLVKIILVIVMSVKYKGKGSEVEGGGVLTIKLQVATCKL